MNQRLITLCFSTFLLATLGSCQSEPDLSRPFSLYHPNKQHHYKIESLKLDTIGPDRLLVYLDEPLAYDLALSGTISIVTPELAGNGHIYVSVTQQTVSGNPLEIVLDDNCAIRLQHDYMKEIGLGQFIRKVGDENAQYVLSVMPHAARILENFSNIGSENMAELDTLTFQLLVAPGNTAYWREDQNGFQEVAFLLDCTLAKGKLLEDRSLLNSPETQRMLRAIQPGVHISRNDSAEFTHYIGVIDSVRAEAALKKLKQLNEQQD